MFNVNDLTDNFYLQGLFRNSKAYLRTNLVLFFNKFEAFIFSFFIGKISNIVTFN